jgi:hypothetical protein
LPVDSDSVIVSPVSGLITGPDSSLVVLVLLQVKRGAT